MNVLETVFKERYLFKKQPKGALLTVFRQFVRCVFPVALSGQAPAQNYQLNVREFVAQRSCHWLRLPALNAMATGEPVASMDRRSGREFFGETQPARRSLDLRSRSKAGDSPPARNRLLPPASINCKERISLPLSHIAITSAPSLMRTPGCRLTRLQTISLH